MRNALPRGQSTAPSIALLARGSLPHPRGPDGHSGHGSQSTGRGPTDKSDIELELYFYAHGGRTVEWGTMSRAESAIDWGRMLTMQ